MTTDISPAAPSPAPPPEVEAEDGKEQNLLQEILSGSWLVSLLAIVLALLLGGVLIAVSNTEVVAAAENFFAAPGEFFATLFSTVGKPIRRCSAVPSSTGTRARPNAPSAR
jgi:hypothetical protein